MAESNELKEEIIEGVTVYRITDGNYGGDETDFVDPRALQRMRKSGWWGDQSKIEPSEDGLKPEYLSAVLEKKCGRSHSDLKSHGVYMYLKKSDNQIYIGSAVNETLLERQIRHLNDAASTNVDHLDKFDQQLSRQYGEGNWHFYAIPMSSKDPEKICEKEKELIAQYNSIKHGYNV